MEVTLISRMDNEFKIKIDKKDIVLVENYYHHLSDGRNKPRIQSVIYLSNGREIEVKEYKKDIIDMFNIDGLIMSFKTFEEEYLNKQPYSVYFDGNIGKYKSKGFVLLPDTMADKTIPVVYNTLLKKIIGIKNED